MKNIDYKQIRNKYCDIIYHIATGHINYIKTFKSNKIHDEQLGNNASDNYNAVIGEAIKALIISNDYERAIRIRKMSNKIYSILRTMIFFKCSLWMWH